MLLNVNELKEIKGGAVSVLNATFFNALARSLSTISDIGRSLGTAIRMLFSKRVCNDKKNYRVSSYYLTNSLERIYMNKDFYTFIRCLCYVLNFLKR